MASSGVYIFDFNLWLVVEAQELELKFLCVADQYALHSHPVQAGVPL
jgi:hypothetical protein